MKVMLMLRAAAMMFSLGISSTYAGDDTSQSARPPFTPIQDQPHSVSVGASQAPPLFTIGRIEVHVWAPVAPPYNAEANEDLATKNIWGAG